jgi:hypothetical protein
MTSTASSKPSHKFEETDSNANSLVKSHTTEKNDKERTGKQLHFVVCVYLVRVDLAWVTSAMQLLPPPRQL